MSESVKNRLVHELKEIYDNKDFVCGAVSNAGDEKAWEVMLDFIKTARQQGEALSSDDILLLSLDLGEEFRKSDKQKKGLKIAML